MSTRGCGIRYLYVIASLSIGKVLSTIGSSVYKIEPNHAHDKYLKIHKFWTYVGRKKRLMYAYSLDTSKIVAYT